MNTNTLYIALVAAFVASGCTSFSSYQSAKLLPQGKSSVTAAVSTIAGDGDEVPGVDLHIGELMVRHRVQEDLEVGVRYARLGLQRTGANALFGDFKTPLVRDKLAFSLPVGIVYADGQFGPPQLQPGLLCRLELSPNAALELASKAIVSTVLEDDNVIDLMFAGNVGLRLGNERFAIHPELGLLHVPGDSQTYYQLGVGVSLVQ